MIKVTEVILKKTDKIIIEPSMNVTDKELLNIAQFMQGQIQCLVMYPSSIEGITVIRQED